MYLIVIVTLVISILGLFIQTLSLQTARMNAQQNPLAQTMVSWHNAAVILVNSTPPDAVPCQLTSTTAVNGLPVCTHSGAPLLLNATNLPTGYQTGTYSFISMVFQPVAATDFVFTYAHDSDATGSLILPQTGGTSIGYSLQNLQMQLSRSLPVELSQGTVTATGILQTVMTGISGTTTHTSYTIAGSIPVNAVGVVSAAQ